jgi:hypothetical protein
MTLGSNSGASMELQSWFRSALSRKVKRLEKGGCQLAVMFERVKHIRCLHFCEGRVPGPIPAVVAALGCMDRASVNLLLS